MARTKTITLDVVEHAKLRGLALERYHDLVMELATGADEHGNPNTSTLDELDLMIDILNKLNCPVAVPV